MMKGKVCFIIILRICFTATQTFHKSSRGLQSFNFSNKKILEVVSAEDTVNSAVDCGVFCMETSGCLSFAHNTVSSLCYLWDKDFTNVSLTNVTDEHGWKYYHFVIDCSLKKDICLGNEGFIYEPDSCLCIKYFATKMFYNESVEACASLNAELVKVDRGFVQMKMEQFLDSVTYGEVRIQGIRDNITNIWEYNDGSEMQYFNWNGDQPEERVNEFYPIIRKSRQYRWHDTFPHEKFAVICQIKL